MNVSRLDIKVLIIKPNRRNYHKYLCVAVRQCETDAFFITFLRRASLNITVKNILIIQNHFKDL